MANYGTIVDADLFFATRLHTFDWDQASITDRTKSLSHATMLIDQFDYIQQKYTVCQLGSQATQAETRAAELAQELEFPRGDSNVVPLEIERATYLIAQALLSGRDPDMDLEALANSGVSYGAVRATYDRSQAFEHTTHLIPSPEAFNLIRPFFESHNSFDVKRV